MKLSLRNLALGATLFVAGAAMAQDAPFTVTQNWKIEADKTLTHSGGVRFGTGYNGKLYVPDKSDNTLAVISYVDGAAKIEKIALNWEGLKTLGVGAGSDEAGNILLNKDFPGTNTSTDFLIVTADGQQIPLQITLPEGVAPARVDQIGRIAGNMMSEEGGWIFLPLTGANTVSVVKIANGEQVPNPIAYCTSEPVEVTINTSTIIQPLYSGAELNDMGDDAINGWAARNRSSQTIYLGDGSTLAKPAGANSPEGFDVFTLGDKLYQVQPIKVAANYEPGFVIADEEGNILYTATYDNMGNGGQSFGGFTAHKVSDTKVELYQVYTSGAGNNYAMYTIELPGGDDPQPVELPNVFLRGAMTDWNVEYSYMFMPVIPEGAEEPVANENGEYEYQLYLDALMGDFKLCGPEADWSGFNYGAKGGDNTVTADCTKEAWAGSSEHFAMGNLTLTEVTLSFFYNPDASKPSYLKVQGTEYVEPKPLELPNVFLRGAMTDWNAEYSYMFMPVIPEGAEEPVANENGEYEYKLYLDALMGDFKLAGNEADWSGFNYGAKGGDNTVTADCTKEAWAGSSENFAMGDLTLTEVTLSFFYNPDASKPSYLKIQGTEYVEPAPTTEKGHFAYDLKVEKVDGVNHTISFKSTGDAAKAVLVLTQEGNEDNVIETELGEVKKGDNSFAYSAADLENEKKYNWAIRLHNYKVDALKITEPVNVGGDNAGLVVFTDPEYPEVYGKVVIGRTNNGGIDIYAPDGVLEAEGLFKNTLVTPAEGTANASSPMDGKQRGTEAVFASWGDKANGVVAVDIADLNNAPYSVFEGVKEANGKIMNGDIPTGSGTPCVAFYGEGDATDMYVFDEDIFGNNLAVSHIGANKTVGTALEMIGFKNLLANTNVAIWPVEGHGLFISQIRANGMEPGTPGLSWYDPTEGDITWRAADMATTDETFLPSAAAGVAVNPTGDLLAVATYTGIEVYLLSWDGNMPVLEKYMTVASPYANARRSNIQFDVANNIHVTNRTNGYYTVTLPEEEPLALSAAKSNSFIANTSGVENVAIEAADTEAAYYNLNGVRVAADTLTPGVYVKVVGKTATKVVIK